MGSPNLTDKQTRFCEEYVIDWNATRAAREAGYSEDTAYSIGHENLKKPEIQEYIAHLKTQTEQLAGISKLKALKDLSQIASDQEENSKTRIMAYDSISKMMGWPPPKKVDMDINGNINIPVIEWVKRES